MDIQVVVYFACQVSGVVAFCIQVTIRRHRSTQIKVFHARFLRPGKTRIENVMRASNWA